MLYALLNSMTIYSQCPMVHTKCHGTCRMYVCVCERERELTHLETDITNIRYSDNCIKRPICIEVDEEVTNK